MKRTFLAKITFLAILFSLLNLNTTYSQEPQVKEEVLFNAAKQDQQNLKWEASLAKFRKITKAFPKSATAAKAHIEIGKYYKYERRWEEAIEEYHKAIAISPHSREAHDAKTAEAAVYYFRQDFPRALELFQEVLAETKDWDQIKYCSFWLKELRRKMSFSPEESFSCGPESLKIVFKILGIRTEEKDIAKLFTPLDKNSSADSTYLTGFTYQENNAVSISELAKVASQKGLKPKVVKVSGDQLQNLNTPFIALVDPEHYVVVTQTKDSKVKFIDPVNKNNPQTAGLAEFTKNFKGYALIFLEDKKLVRINYPVLSDEQLKALKGGVCPCCPVSNLGGSENNPNVEFDGSAPCSLGMPSWLVNTVNLNLIIQDIDFRYTSRGMPVEFIRTYNGDDPRDGIFGRSWTFNYNISLVENPDHSIDVRRGDGKIDHFIWNGLNYQGPKGVYDTLTKIPGGYSLKLKKDKTTQNFNAQGRLVNIKDRNNNTVTFTYDEAGKLILITDPNNKNVTLTYGANNKVSRLTLADGRFATFTYDVQNNLILNTDMKDATISYTYNSASYLTSFTTPHQGRTNIGYSISGSYGYYIQSITDTLGNQRSYDTYQTHTQVRVLDSRGNATLYKNTYDGYTESVTMSSGNKITFEYDYFGNRNKIKDTLGNTTNLTYDGRGNITSITDPLNNQLILTYDDNDNLISTKDPKNNIYNFTYDTNSNLIEVADPDSQRTSFEYNNFGQVTKITDAKGGVTEFEYDPEGNLIKMINPLGKFSEYGYDTLGRLTSFIDPKRNTFLYAYDGVDHLTKITYPDQTSIVYTYNCCNLIQAEDQNGILKFTYDALGRLTSFTNYDNKVISYDYDSEDNLITLTYPDNKKVNYEYDVDNRLIKVIDWLGNITQYTYDTRGNLSWSISPGLITAYKYDAANRLTKLLNYNLKTLEISSGFEFSLDSVGNRTKIKRFQPLNTATFNTQSLVDYTYNSDNQLLAATGMSFEYDDNGNLTKQIAGLQTTNLTYNFDNQLTSYVSGSTNLSYLYDALGNRIKKTSGSKTTKYILDPNRTLPSVLAEANSSGRITSYYVYGLGLISKIEPGLQPHEVNKTTDNPGPTDGTAYFYQYDGLGSTVALADKNGNIKNKYAYDDFGNLATNSTETVANPFKYVGKFGVATDLPDLVHMRARYYMPSVGRFVNKDPIGTLGNNYTYAGNNPIRFMDPLGLWYIDINLSFGGIGKGITGGVLISGTGIYKYAGFGVMTPGPSGSITFSRDCPAEGWNAGFQGGFIIAYQRGRDYSTLTDFQELGLGTPGFSYTMFYVDRPWVWPWRRK